MDKIRCLMRNIDEEISDAWKYADKSVTWHRAGHAEAAGIFATMAKNELEHAAMNERIMGMVGEMYHDQPDKHQAVDMLREVTRDRIEKAHADVRAMLERGSS